MLRTGATAGVAGGLLAGAQRADAAGTGPLVPTSIKLGNYTAAPGDLVLANPAAGSFTVTLPGVPADQSQVGVDLVYTAGGNSVTVACAGTDRLRIAGGGQVLSLAAIDQLVVLQYDRGDATWYVMSAGSALGAANGAARLGTDATVGGPGGSQLSGTVAILSAPKTWTAKQTFNVSGASLLLKNAQPTPGALQINQQGIAAQIHMQTDWAAQTTGQTTYDTIDIFHRSAGDGIFISNHGGITPATLVTGTVAASNGIVWIANQARSGAQQNAVSVAYVASGAGTRLSASASGSAITVSLATDGSGQATSTAADVIAAAVASAAVQALARAYPLTVPGPDQNPLSSDGSGTVSPKGASNLSGAFTGSSPGGKTAFNSYVPLFNDDGAAGQGTELVYKAGAHNILVQHGNPYSMANGIQVDYRAGQAALYIRNQWTGPLNAAPRSPADGSGQAITINDASTADTINITRQTPPVAQSFSGYAVESVGAVIGVHCGTGTATYPVILVRRSGDSQGLYLRNDGSAAFGLRSAPVGRVQIDSSYGGLATNLTLSNPSTASGAGVAILGLGAGGAQTFKLGALSLGTGETSVNVWVQSKGSLVHALELDGTGVGHWLPLHNRRPSNEARGSGTASLGSNCPGSQPAAPYTWQKVITSDGSTGYMPIWK